MSKLSEEARTTSFGLLNYGKEYFKAYEVLKKSGNFKEFSPVLLYLFCHGVELILKAFLKSEKLSNKDLKRIGHDLQKLCERGRMSKSDSFNIFTNHDLAVISLLNSYYKEKEFEYILIGSKSLPSKEDIEDTYKNIVEFVGQIEHKCLDSSKIERKQQC